MAALAQLVPPEPRLEIARYLTRLKQQPTPRANHRQPSLHTTTTVTRPAAAAAVTKTTTAATTTN